MSNRVVYEYAIIRYVPKVEREEFLNIGIILFSKKAQYLAMKYLLSEHKIKVIDPAAALTELDDYLIAWQHICQGNKEGGAIAQLEKHERFRWLTSTRSTIIQCSSVHPGMTNDLPKLLDSLYHQYVV